MYAIRGATTIDANNSQDIKKASIELMENIISSNNLNTKDIISMVFSCTQDITKDYPGKFVREHFNLKNTAIMHFNEMYVENSLNLCIRVMLYVNGDNQNVKYVYLKNAKSLRKDLLNNQ